jgi:hypothetical protein
MGPAGPGSASTTRPLFEIKAQLFYEIRFRFGATG